MRVVLVLCMVFLYNKDLCIKTIEVGRVSLSLLFDHGVCKHTYILLNRYKYQGKIFS